MKNVQDAMKLPTNEELKELEKKWESVKAHVKNVAEENAKNQASTWLTANPKSVESWGQSSMKIGERELNQERQALKNLIDQIKETSNPDNVAGSGNKPKGKALESKEEQDLQNLIDEINNGRDRLHMW
jgi:hypothetical protein